MPAEQWIDLGRTSDPGSILAAEHRILLGQDIGRIKSALLARADPRSAACSSNTDVSSSSFVSVTGMAAAVYVPFHGSLDITGSLYVSELTAGSFSARIVNDSDVLWTVTLQNQAAMLLSGTRAQLSTWSVPIGGPELLDVVGGTSYNLDVEIAAPAGSYRVLTGSGVESNYKFDLVTTLL